MPELPTIPLNPQALSYILHTLSLWKSDNVELQAKYKYTDFTNTHFLLLQPATLFEYAPKTPIPKKKTNLALPNY